MKKILKAIIFIEIFFFLLSFNIYSQFQGFTISKGIIENQPNAFDGGTPTVQLPNGVWAGAQLFYSFIEESPNSWDNISTSANVLLNYIPTWTDRFAIPIVGNLSNLRINQDSLSSYTEGIEKLIDNGGINFGFYPYYLFGDPNKFSCKFYISESYKLNTITDTANNKLAIHQTKSSVGCEITLNIFAWGKLPGFISFDYNYISLFSNDPVKKTKLNDLNSLNYGSFKAIMPIFENFGIIYCFEFSKEITLNKLGLVISQSIK